MYHNPSDQRISTGTDRRREILVPPSLLACAEIILTPGRKDNLAGIIYIAVRKSQRKRSRSTDNATIWCVLRSVAGAHEFVLGRRPRDNATKMGAH
jgi:hypothetical protein